VTLGSIATRQRPLPGGVSSELAGTHGPGTAGGAPGGTGGGKGTAGGAPTMGAAAAASCDANSRGSGNGGEGGIYWGGWRKYSGDGKVMPAIHV
jgi:hypothetical protein